MSNKTQLQANNTQLASLIQTLQGKAAGGGGSSGGGIGPMCTVEIVADAPPVDTALYYLNSDLSLAQESKTASQVMSGITLSVPAYTPICTDVTYSTQVSDGVIKLGSRCFYITGDAVITIS